MELTIKSMSSYLDQQPKKQLYLKFAFLFPPQNAPVVTLCINPFQSPRGLLTDVLKEHLPLSLQEEPQRIGLHICTDTGMTYLNENQPISTSHIINWDLIVVKLRDACEVKSMDRSGERTNIVIDKTYDVARVTGMGACCKAYRNHFI